MSSSTEHTPPMLVVATAARALAESARKGGMNVIALDRFADRDTREAAVAARAIPANESGFDADALRQAADDLCPPGRCGGLVYGSGFENRVALLQVLARGRSLRGNLPQTVARSKDPGSFFGLLRGLGIPHPETRLARPPDAAGWLAKEAGASGGAHVQPVSGARGRRSDRTLYYQRHWPGRNISLLFLADGSCCQTIGFSEAWTTERDARAPYRYAGAVSDAELAPVVAARLSKAAQALTAALGLKGVNGLDALVRGQEYAVLEVNPRPGATFELYEAKYGESFFALHLRACGGELPGTIPVSPEAHAHAVVYAPCALVIDETVTWPAWCSDLPVPGTQTDRGAPLCMVHAHARTAREARERVLQREARVRDRFAHAPRPAALAEA